MITFRSNLGKGENGEYFAVHYDSCNNIDADKAKRAQDLLEKFFTRIKSHKDMARNVRIIRGIFRDYDEMRLNLEYEDASVRESIGFLHAKLVYFKKSRKNGNGKWEDLITVNCEPGEVDSFKFDGEEDVDYSNLSPVGEYYDFEPNRELLETAELYKLFYGETLDFTDPDVNTKIQVMSLILAHYNIYSGYSWDAKEIHLQDDGLVYAISLKKLIDESFPYGEIDNQEESYLDEEDKKRVVVIGKTIMGSIKDASDKVQALNQIGKILVRIKDSSCEIGIIVPDAEEQMKKIIAACNSTKRYACSEEEIKATVKTLQTINGKLYPGLW